ncbi:MULTISPECIES: hypothetical protein [Myxococcus]|uniref:hypothetical protein n=1 Tax=Myxococcus TaxID=32 RepID=UPI00112ED1D8|nr:MULTISPECIES: hypothetical protein [Myxococcus]QDE80773.1 hypothetical protein BHS07_03950 [Myxococcus xanthus]WAM27300.1 hypothetical protein OZ403_04015 [Myxococcus sp. NMCA1]
MLAKLHRLESLIADSTQPEVARARPGYERLSRLRTLDLQVYAYQAQAFLTSPLAQRMARLQLRMGLSSAAPDALAVPLARLALAPTLKIPDFTLQLVRASTKDWASIFRFVREPSVGLSVHVSTTEMSEPPKPSCKATCSPDSNGAPR